MDDAKGSANGVAIILLPYWIGVDERSSVLNVQNQRAVVSLDVTVWVCGLKVGAVSKD